MYLPLAKFAASCEDFDTHNEEAHARGKGQASLSVICYSTLAKRALPLWIICMSRPPRSPHRVRKREEIWKTIPATTTSPDTNTTMETSLFRKKKCVKVILEEILVVKPWQTVISAILTFDIHYCDWSLASCYGFPLPFSRFIFRLVEKVGRKKSLKTLKHCFLWHFSAWLNAAINLHSLVSFTLRTYLVFTNKTN